VIDAPGRADLPGGRLLVSLSTFLSAVAAAPSIRALKNNFNLVQIFLASIVNIRILHLADSLQTFG
jgi:hypothetical protein